MKTYLKAYEINLLLDCIVACSKAGLNTNTLLGDVSLKLLMMREDVADDALEQMP